MSQKEGVQWLVILSMVMEKGLGDTRPCVCQLSLSVTWTLFSLPLTGNGSQGFSSCHYFPSISIVPS
jgi:hypothetical protein